MPLTVDQNALASTAPQTPVSGGSGFDVGNFAMGAQLVSQISGSMASSYIAKNQYRMQQDLARFKSKVAMEKAEFASDRIRRAQTRLRGAQIAAIGASGLEFSGTAIDLIADSMNEFDMDVLAVKRSAVLEQSGYAIDSAIARANSNIASASSVLGLSNAALEAALYYGEGR